MAVREVKLCLLGDSGVGKSSIVMRFVKDTFREQLESTIGASFMAKKLVVNDNTFLFQIWDTAGQEKVNVTGNMFSLFERVYRALAPMYYRGAEAAIVVYDVTNEVSFDSVKDWVKELKRNGVSNMVIAIAGNKCDLKDLREVNTKDAQEYADNIGAVFTETSALTAVNIPELFTSIAKMLPDADVYEPKRQGSKVYLRKNQQEAPKRRGCCGGGQS